ncbi:MAG: DUF1566 domain-containing protein [Myxococcaceae bacterium]
MKFLITIICLSTLCSVVIAARLSFTDVNDPQSKQLLGQLVSEHWSDPEDEAQLTASAMSSLLAYMAPMIKLIPGYAGLFAGNCSVFFSNATIEQIGCNIIPVAVVSVNESLQLNSQIRLPQEYATQITQSNILLASLWADWSRRIAQKVEQFEVSLFSKVSTCTRTESNSETPVRTASKTESGTATHSVSRSTSPTISHSNSDTLTLSESSTTNPSNSSTTTHSTLASASTSQSSHLTMSGSVSQKPTNSASLTKSPYPVCSMDIYADKTNQPARYLVSGEAPNSTVADLWTGVVWEQVVSETPLTWPLAQTYCASLSKGGYSDWRLPSITELQSLVDYAKETSGATIEDTAFPSTPPNATWTSTANAGIAGYFWDLEFARGQMAFDLQGNSKAVRCVRGVSLNPTNRYTDENGYRLTNQSTQVRDVVTGLTWERTPPGFNLSWSAAQAYCQGLTLGAANWRLPRVKELTSLVDYTASNPAINTTAFPALNSNFFWSSTPCVDAAIQGWIVNLNSGLISYDSTLRDANQARCVRDSVWASNSYADATNQIDRYVIAGNGTDAVVTDTFTGLIWEQTSSPSSMTWKNATSYCAGLLKNNYGCWRLPTPLELHSLVNHQASSHISINEAAFPATISDDFWTSAYAVGLTGNSWYGYFGYYGLGYIGYDTVSTVYPVRCVRGNDFNWSNRYTDENGDVLTNQSIQVKDQKTGLLWQRAQSSSAMQWNASSPIGSAQSYCQNLVIGYDGAGSWRLPAVKELLTLVDYTSSTPSINTTTFPGTTSLTYAVSSQWGSAASLSYYVSFGNGIVNGHYYAGYSDTVRCVLNTSAPTNNGMWSPLAYEDATNQTARYYVSGTSPNAIVTDDFTGLMWEQQVSSSTYFWNASAPVGSAQAYCASLNKGGYADWRLPTPQELQSLSDYTQTNPAIGSLLFPGVVSSHFWTSFPLANYPGQSWVAYSGSGYMGADAFNTNNSVRCMRSVVKPATDRYLDEYGNQVSPLSLQVKDQVTGLLWQRRSSSVAMTWNLTQGYCDNLVVGSDGLKSWRLPTVKELTSLVDYSLYTLSINQTAFPETLNSYYWSSSFMPLTDYFWNVVFSAGGTVNTGLKTGSGYVRCLHRENAVLNNGMWSPLTFQDATNQIARYYVSGSSPNAIVTDDFTGLMWEQQVSGSTYFWNASAPAGSAQSYCANLTKGGYTDWRLPTPLELQSLVDYKMSSVSYVINPTAFPGTPSNVYCTNQLPVIPQLTDRVWQIYFNPGNSGGCINANGGVGSTFYNVRCVRKKKSSNIPNRYTDQNENNLTNSSVQVKDIVTGLIWQRKVASVLLPWNSTGIMISAQDYCQNLVIDNQGAGSWRLPTVKELLTLNDFTRCRPSINNTVFLGVAYPNYGFWPSTPTAGEYNTAYIVSFEYGEASHWYMDASSTLSVRCILNTSAPANKGRWSPLAYQDATNQTARYYVSGTAPNAIVTDDFTGLMWEQQVSNLTYVWNASAPAGSAQSYCTGLRKGGYADWRLPTVVELQSLVDYTIATSSVINFTAFPNTPNGYFWTSLVWAANSAEPWIVGFSSNSNSGATYFASSATAIPYSVRCVRGNKTILNIQYTDESDNGLTAGSVQVKDQITGLIWQRTQAPSLYNWSASAAAGSAQTYCQLLTLGNVTWRLPTVKELTSLVDYGIVNPSINTTIFPGTSNNGFWSSTALAASSINAWSVDFGYDGGMVTSGGNTSNSRYVRCVRP